jgi:hypothetical protein
VFQAWLGNEISIPVFITSIPKQGHSKTNGGVFMDLEELKLGAEKLLRGSKVCFSWLKEDFEEFLNKVIEFAEDDENLEEGWFVCDAGKGVKLVKYRQGDQNSDSIWMNYRAPARVGALRLYRDEVKQKILELDASIKSKERILIKLQEMIDNEQEGPPVT